MSCHSWSSAIRDGMDPKLRIQTLDPPGAGGRRTIIIGDIHGCWEELQNLLSKIGYQVGDRLISVGDMVAKGSKSLEVLRFFHKTPECYSVMGNHEFIISRILDHESAVLGQHAEIAHQLDSDEIDYLKNLPHIINLPQYNTIVLHGGINPAYAWDQQHPYDILHTRSANLHIDGQCCECFSEHNKWLTIWNTVKPINSPFIVFGHDAASKFQHIQDTGLGLDTGCVYRDISCKLTCYILPSKEIISINTSRNKIHT